MLPPLELAHRLATHQQPCKWEEFGLVVATVTLLYMMSLFLGLLLGRRA